MIVSIAVPDAKFQAKILNTYEKLKIVRRKAHEVRSLIYHHPNFIQYCKDKYIGYGWYDLSEEEEYSEEYGTLSSNVMYFINNALDTSKENLYIIFFCNKFLTVIEPLVQALDMQKSAAVIKIDLDEHDVLQLWRIDQIDYSNCEERLDTMLVQAQTILDNYMTPKTKRSLWEIIGFN
jgi:hypothetical protein